MSQRSATLATTRLSLPLLTLTARMARTMRLPLTSPSWTPSSSMPHQRVAQWLPAMRTSFGAAHADAAQVAVDVVRVDAVAGAVVDVDARSPPQTGLAVAGDAHGVAAERRDVAALHVVPRDLDVGAAVDDDRAVHGAVAYRCVGTATDHDGRRRQQEVRLGHTGHGHALERAGVTGQLDGRDAERQPVAVDGRAVAGDRDA